MKPGKKMLWPVFVAFLSMLATGIWTGGQGVEEYKLKSGFIFRICKFTRWPDPVDPGKPFIISLLGDISPDKEIVAPKKGTLDKRTVMVRKITELTEINGSDVLFINGSEANRIDDILAYTAGKPILTIGDTPGFGEKGVIINFYIQQNKVRFEINYEASKKASLKMHSQLFTIGRVVKTRE